MTPRATYRLQLHKDFTFDDAARQAPYLAQLGVSHAYLSPIQTARSGSMHGYDIVDHGRINPELGGEAAFEAMAAMFQQNGLGIILDIVPNHMAVGGGDNAWWLDVLKHGQVSTKASFFDIDFDAPGMDGKILTPFLGAPYGDVLNSGDLTLVRDRAGELAVAYHHHRFPLRPEDQSHDVNIPMGSGDLHALLERQHFRLAWWRTAGDRINWRRFFDITELAGLRVEQDDVFDAVHAIPLDLYARGLIDGVRVDHVDGLAHPAAYCRRLRARLEALRPGERAYIVVEKILGDGEMLDPSWHMDGTTGYDFMDEVSAVQHDPAGDAALTSLWTEISNRPGHFDEEETAARAYVLTSSFEGQLSTVARAFETLAAKAPETRDLTASAFRRAIIRLIVHLRVYRSYATGQAGSPQPSARVSAAIVAARSEQDAECSAFDFIEAAFAGPDAADAVRRLNQLSAPVTAKAVEDTAFYRYGRLLSRNDVGFAAHRFALSAQQFHDRMAMRAAMTPDGMLATATHDHKRGEDVRSRLAVLGDVPALWREQVTSWFALNAAVRPDSIAPDDEYQLYQTMFGAWPPDLAPSDRAGLLDFRDRVSGWRTKSLREAKLRSSWAAPDAAYEAANEAFLTSLLDPAVSSKFLDSMARLVDRLAPVGAANGLVQTVLRCTVPGVPDTYQGTEFWDFSLVDPDNRRPVDYKARLDSLSSALPVDQLVGTWRDGRIKQAVLASILKLRTARPQLFARGSYLPLRVSGRRKDHVVAFVREAEGEQVFVIAALHCAEGIGADRLSPDPGWWGDTSVHTGWTGPLCNVLDAGSLPECAEKSVSAVLQGLPAGILVQDY